MNSYSNPENARMYAEFLNSEEGQTQQRLLWDAVSHLVPAAPGARVLDAACGTGWFAGRFSQEHAGVDVRGCDASPALVDQARVLYPNVPFKVADLSECYSVDGVQPPYAPRSFTSIVLNMAMHDFYDLQRSLANLFTMAKAGGTLIATVANPYYSYPVGMWKRGWTGAILNAKPRLKLDDYGKLMRSADRTFEWHSGNRSYFYTLPEMVNAATAAGFTLSTMHDVMDTSDSSKFSRQYKMYRYPLVILLEFSKAKVDATGA